MQPCIDSLLTRLRPKIRAIVKLKHVFSVANLLNQYKAHIWSKSEYHDGALLIAGHIKLRKLDKMQRGFLYELALNDKYAFLHFNFAPPSLRRAIGILGFLHNRILGKCHPALAAVFPLRGDPANGPQPRQLEPFFAEVRGHAALYNRFIYVYILIYNRLPQEITDSETVSAFQSRLTRLAKARAQQDESNLWRDAFQSCADVVEMFYA